MAVLDEISAGTGHLIPDAERAGSERPVVHSAEQMPADAKEILHGSVHREKPLRVRGGFEAPHLALPLPGRLVGDFRQIVRVLVRAVDHRRHHGPERRWVAASLVGDQP